MSLFPWTALVTLAAISLYMIVTFRTGRMRAKHHVKAPSIDGPEEFQRAYRVQANTLEQIVPFLPALWLFAAAWGDLLGAGLGLAWVAGRGLYALAYYRDPRSRGPGFLAALAATIVLIVGAALGAIGAL